jgi:hypothetical protein
LHLRIYETLLGHCGPSHGLGIVLYIAMLMARLDSSSEIEGLFMREGKRLALVVGFNLFVPWTHRECWERNGFRF